VCVCQGGMVGEGGRERERERETQNESTGWHMFIEFGVQTLPTASD
jgi:hypothetical protein